MLPRQLFLALTTGAAFPLCGCSPDTSTPADASALGDAPNGDLACPGSSAPFQCLGTRSLQSLCPVFPAACDGGSWTCSPGGAPYPLDAGCPSLPCGYIGGTCVRDGGCAIATIGQGSCMDGQECCQDPICALLGGVCVPAGCEGGAVLAYQSTCGSPELCCSLPDGSTADAGAD